MTDWAAWKHIVVTPLRSNSLRGLEVESECCQFGHWAMTTALSSISSDRPISTDANTHAWERRTDTQEYKHRVQLGEAALLAKTLMSALSTLPSHRHIASPVGSEGAHFTYYVLKHITNLRPQGERHLCFISAHKQLANDRASPQRGNWTVQSMRLSRT